MTASGRECPRCRSGRVDGTAGDDYECATCGRVFPDPLDRDRSVYDTGEQRRNLTEGTRALIEMSPDDWPPTRGESCE